MSAASLERLKEIFHAARELPPKARHDFLHNACGHDESLRQEIEALLDSDNASSDFIADAPSKLAAEVFGGSQGHSDVGRTIGHYKLLECVGTGGMGAVYLAERADRQFQMQVAIKLIKRGMDTDILLRRFQHERQILASLEHPNIARLLDGGETDEGLPYFVMEHVKGERIDRYAAAHGLSTTARLELFRQVCGAVSYAHQRLVVHRDLKPSNILVRPEGVPKLLDFGIAKIIRSDEAGGEFATITAAPLLTPQYASPEQIEGAPATTLSDVYSLGAVLYELLSGRPPHHSKTRSRQEIAQAVARAEVEKPSAIVTRLEDARHLRGDLDNIVLMALRKETSRRYQSVEQFSEDIRRHLVGRPVIARADTLSYRAGKFLQRNKASVAAALLVLLSLVGGIVATAWQAQRARLHEQRARAEQARAERRFEEVRKLASSLLFDYHDAIKDLPGSTPVRARLVRDALEHFDRLAGEASGDESLQRELASAYERVGDVQGGSMFANLGDTAGAIESYRKALRLREASLEVSPAQFEAQKDVALSHRKLGLLVWETGDIDVGLDHVRKALALIEPLARERPDDPELRYQLHKSHDYLGMILHERGALAEGLAHYRKGLEIIEASPPAEQATERIRRSFSVSYEHIGTAHLSMNELESALEQNRRALSVRAALSADFPLNADYRRTLLVSYYNDGEILAKMGRYREALESYQRDHSIAQELVAADPKNTQYRDDLAYALIRIGDMLDKLGEFANALERYREALKLRSEDTQADPRNLWKRASLIEVHAKLTRTLAATGAAAPAFAAAKEAVALMEATTLEPTNASIRGFFAETFVDLGDAHAMLAAGRSERRQAACDMYRRSLEILQDLGKRGLLIGADATKPEAVGQKIAACESGN